MRRCLPPGTCRPKRISGRAPLIAALAVGAVVAMSPSTTRAASGQLQITTLDKESGGRIPCLMSIRDQGGRYRKPPKTVAHEGYFVVPGEILLRLGRGTYNFELQRGLEYRPYQAESHFIVDRFGDDAKELRLERFVDMSEKGWWSGDLDVHRPIRDMPLLLEAADLHMAQDITWPSAVPDVDLQSTEPLLQTLPHARAFHAMGVELTSPAGTYNLFGLEAPPSSVTPQGIVAPGQETPDAGGEYPSIEQFLAAAQGQENVWVDATRPYWWDVPTLAANGLLDSVQVLHGNIQYDKTVLNEGNGRPRDKSMFPPPWGNAVYSVDIYFKLLECGLRIPPTAGSGSGATPNPPGANRVYVRLFDDEPFSREAWFDALRAGRAFVTNGPLLTTSVQGEPPGATFSAPEGETVELQIGMTLSTRDPIDYLEIIQNGRVEHSVRIRELAAAGGRLPPVVFERSGWFLVRAVSERRDTYRVAMTAPYFVQIGEEPRISREAAQFFLAWVHERAERIDLPDGAKRDGVMAYHRKARDFFQKLAEDATAD